MNKFEKLGKRFVLFRVEKGKKIPINAKNGRYARCNDPTTFCDYQTAKEALSKYNCDCLGIALGDGLNGIDLDHCYDSDFTDFAKEVLNKYDSYSEFSPSGKGIHILVNSDNQQNIKQSQCEIYSKNRFFTLTEKPIKNKDIKSCDLSDLVEKIKPIPKSVGSCRYSSPISKIFKPTGAKAQLLFSGGSLYNDPSRDDMCAIGILKQSGYSREEISSIMRETRYREKFDEDRGGRTYLDLSIDRAFGG